MKLSTAQALDYLSERNEYKAVRMFHRGITLGGYTDWHNGIDRKYGYVVGGVVPTFKVSLNFLTPEMLTLLANWLVVNAVHGNGDGIGVWLDEDILYFDVVEWSDSLSYALKLADERGELAIYDIENSRCIDTNEGLR